MNESTLNELETKVAAPVERPEEEQNKGIIPQDYLQTPATNKANKSANVKWCIHGNLLKVFGPNEAFILNEVLNWLQIAPDLDAFLTGDDNAGWITCGYTHLYHKYGMEDKSCTRAVNNLLTRKSYENSKIASFRNHTQPKATAKYKDAPPKCLGLLQRRTVTRYGTQYKLDLTKLLVTLNAVGLWLGDFVVNVECSQYNGKRLSHLDLCKLLHLDQTPKPKEIMEETPEVTDESEDVFSEDYGKTQPIAIAATEAEIVPIAPKEDWEIALFGNLDQYEDASGKPYLKLTYNMGLSMAFELLKDTQYENEYYRYIVYRFDLGSADSSELADKIATKTMEVGYRNWCNQDSKCEHAKLAFKIGQRVFDRVTATGKQWNTTPSSDAKHVLSVVTMANLKERGGKAQ